MNELKRERYKENGKWYKNIIQLKKSYNNIKLYNLYITYLFIQYPHELAYDVCNTFYSN